jgi:hypothetical protein
VNRDPKIDAHATELLLADLIDADEKLREQFPPEPPPVAYHDTGLSGRFLPEKDAVYPDHPPMLRTIPLLRTKYATRDVAERRAREIVAGTGERIYRFFSTGRYFVAQVFKPRRTGEGIR